MTQLLPVYVKSAIMLTDASNNCDLEVNMELYIGQNLKNFRKARNLTQEEVAKHLGPSVGILPTSASFIQLSFCLFRFLETANPSTFT